MAIKVFRPHPNSDLNQIRFLDQRHSLPFILEREHFEFTDEMSESDVIVLLPNNEDAVRQFNTIKDSYRGQLILLLHIFHSEENFSSRNVHDFYIKTFKEINPLISVVHTEMGNNDGIYYDWLWNRQKLLFTDYDTYGVGGYNYMDNATKKMYELSDIVPKTWGCKKFMCIGRIRRGDYSDRNVRRSFLRDYLRNHDGYVNDPENNITFISQESVPHHTHDKRNAIIDYSLDAGFGKIHPVHDLYYHNSVFSAYIETLTYFGESQIHTITEKTWNPLIKGHHILPFGYCGLIKDIKSYGFELPEWIDYSYDEIENDSFRFTKYIESLNRLLDMSNQDLIHLDHGDMDLLRHNREVFFNRGYSKLQPLIKNIIDEHTQ